MIGDEMARNRTIPEFAVRQQHPVRQQLASTFFSGTQAQWQVPRVVGSPVTDS